MVNCNPETVSTDYDTSDRLYFEPLTLEDVLNVIEAEQADRATLAGVIVGLGGQTPLKLAGVAARGPGARHQSRRRSTWPRTASGGTRCAPGSRSRSRRAAPPPRSTRPLAIVDTDRLPGARAAVATCSAAGPWRSSTTTTTCARAMAELAGFGILGARAGCRPSGPVLVDRFLEDAIEVDVDAIRDAHRRGASSAG